MPPTEATRTLSVSTALGADVLLLQTMTAVERLSTPFEFELALESERIDIRANDLLGTPATVSLLLEDGGHRFFNGYISRFSYVGFNGTLGLYRATLVPWLWFLSRAANCRIFQDKQVIDIVKEVFRDQGFTDFVDRLTGSYRQWTYCVQYRETDLNFVSRLLEHEGIYYYHEHTDGKHTLVLADSYSAHSPYPGYAQVPFYLPGPTALRDHERLDDWTLASEVRPGAFAHNSFDFTAPRKGLLARSSAPKGHALSGLEVFDYQGDYAQSADGDGYARIRLQEAQAEYEIVQAAGNARGLGCGGLFTLTDHPRADQNREYLIVSARYTLQSDKFRSNATQSEAPVFACTLSAIDAQVPYRPLRETRKPIVQGPQTAIVVGKAGEEIWPDKYGRVKVQFHWDRYGKANETSSCWVRVAQVWAGKNWGGMMIPRIGQEVIVDFLEGDPDQPIITGRVYNGDQMPPWDLPANMTQSGLLTRSTKGGAYATANALRFEDKKGAEQVWLHAEKNQDIEVENDETHWVGHDRTKTVDHDETVHVKHDRVERVDHDETVSIGHNRVLVVENDENKSVHNDLTQTVIRNRTRSVGGDESVRVAKTRAETVVMASFESVGAAKALTVGGAYQVSVGAAMNVTVGGLRAVEVGAASMEMVAGNRSIKVGGGESIDIGKDQTVSVRKDLKHSVSGKRTEAVQKEYALTAKKVTLTAEDELLLVSGSAKILLKKNGDIQISGKAISVKGSGDVIIKGSKILEN